MECLFQLNIIINLKKKLDEVTHLIFEDTDGKVLYKATTNNMNRYFIEYEYGHPTPNKKLNTYVFNENSVITVITPYSVPDSDGFIYDLFGSKANDDGTIFHKKLVQMG